MARKSVNTTLDEELYKQVRLLALNQGKKGNDLLEEGMRLVLEKYDVRIHLNEEDKKWK